jgi:hypothetical protein
MPKKKRPVSFKEFNALLGIRDRRARSVAVNNFVAEVIQLGEPIPVEYILGARIATIRSTDLKQPVSLLHERFVGQRGDKGIDALSRHCLISTITQHAQLLFLTVDELLPVLRSDQGGGPTQVMESSIQCRMQ